VSVSVDVGVGMCAFVCVRACVCDMIMVDDLESVLCGWGMGGVWECTDVCS